MAEEYTLNFDKDDLEAMQETAQEATDAFIQRREDERVEQEASQQIEQQAADVKFDPRNAETWGAKALIKKASPFYLVDYKTLHHHSQPLENVQ